MLTGVVLYTLGSFDFLSFSTKHVQLAEHYKIRTCFHAMCIEILRLYDESNKAKVFHVLYCVGI